LFTSTRTSLPFTLPSPAIRLPEAGCIVLVPKPILVSRAANECETFSTKPVSGLLDYPAAGIIYQRASAALIPLTVCVLVLPLLLLLAFAPVLRWFTEKPDLLMPMQISWVLITAHPMINQRCDRRPCGINTMIELQHDKPCCVIYLQFHIADFHPAGCSVETGWTDRHN